MFKLVISDDEGKTTSVPLVRDEITIGRKEGNTIRLTERNVSRRHARLEKQNGHYLLHDLGSYNGIIINGARLNHDEPRPLRHGDQILIGDYKLAILEEASAQSSVPPVDPRHHADTEVDRPVVPVPPPTHSTAPGIPSVMATMQGIPVPPGAQTAAPVELGPSGVPIAPAPTSMPPPSGQVVPDEIREMRLVFLAPAGTPPPVTLERLPMILGRSEAADVVLPFSSISREHARMSWQNGELIIEDLGSSNGVVINGEKCTRGPITAGDLVTLGVVEFRLARRGDSTVMLARDPTPVRRRNAVPVVGGVLG